MRKLVYVFALAGAMGLLFNAGCDRKPPEDVTKVEAGEAVVIEEEEASDAATAEAETPAETAAAPAAEPAPAAETETVLLISPNMESFLTFIGYGGIMGQMEGGFANFNGEIRFKGEDLSTAKVKVEIDMPSIYSESNKLTKELQGENFFEVSTYPAATFQSTSIEESDGGYSVTGNLEMHGETKSITFPVQAEADGDNLRATGEFRLDRTQWGMVYNDWGGSTINDEALVNFEILAEPAPVEEAAPMEEAAPAEEVPAGAA